MLAQLVTPVEYVARLGTDDLRIIAGALAVAYFAVEWIGRRS